MRTVMPEIADRAHRAPSGGPAAILMTCSSEPATPVSAAMTSGRRRAFLRGLAAAMALGLASAAYQAAGEARDRRRFPPPDRLVDVGGYRLHLLCAGQGSPAVVVIPALGGAALGWLTIQRSLATETTVCLYDRAGLGWSDLAHGRRT